MSQHREELPLFPLHAVLFPYARIQLHVFEERYRSMIQRCVEFDQPFGIVLIRSGSEVGEHADPYMVGTAVRVLNVHRYDDGRMDVSVEGQRRFRVRKLDDTRPFLVGHVEPVLEVDVEDNPRTDALMMRARESFRALIEGVFSRQEFKVSITFHDDPTVLSFMIASFLPLENIDKQRLLEITDTTERLAELIPLIEKQILESRAASRVYRLGPENLAEWIQPN